MSDDSAEVARLREALRAMLDATDGWMIGRDVRAKARAELAATEAPR